MAKTSRDLVSGSGTVSTTLSSENLTFSQSQDLLWGAAVVLNDGQQFTIRDGAGTAWIADQRATATASGKTFQTSDATTSRARGSGPIIVKGLHFLYIAPVDDQGNADAYAYYDTLVPNEDGRHPYTRDEYSGQKFYQEEPPGDFMVPPRYRWWDDFPNKVSFWNNNVDPPGWVVVPFKAMTAGVLKMGASGAGPGGYSPFAGYTDSAAEGMLTSCRLGKRPILHVRWAPRPQGTAYDNPKTRLGFMNTLVVAGGAVDPANGVYFRHGMLSSGTIKAVARKANTETELDTGVSVSSGVYHLGMLISRFGGTAVEVWIDGVMKGLLTTNLPDPTTDLGLVFALENTNHFGNGYDLDYYYVEADRPS